MTKSPHAVALGKLGGLATKKKYGNKHFSKLAKKKYKQYSPLDRVKFSDDKLTNTLK